MNQPKTIITQIRIYVPVVTLSTQDNVKLLKQSESGCKRKINWNKYQPKVTEQTLNRIFLLLLLTQVFKEEIDFLFYHSKIREFKKVISNIFFQP